MFLWQSGKQKVGGVGGQLQQILSYLTHIRLTRSNQRTLLMIKAAKQNLTQVGIILKKKIIYHY